MGRLLDQTYYYRPMTNFITVILIRSSSRKSELSMLSRTVRK